MLSKQVVNVFHDDVFLRTQDFAGLGDLEAGDWLRAVRGRHAATCGNESTLVYQPDELSAGHPNGVPHPFAIAAPALHLALLSSGFAVGVRRRHNNNVSS